MGIVPGQHAIALTPVSNAGVRPGTAVERRYAGRLSWVPVIRAAEMVCEPCVIEWGSLKDIRVLPGHKTMVLRHAHLTREHKKAATF